jgi:MFS family permease
MLLQACALGVLAASGGAVSPAAVGAVLLGLGTALVYPTLIAAISDRVNPVARAPVVGVYRFWRDSGYVVGGLVAGVAADALGFGGAIALVAGLTAASGLWVALDFDRDAYRRPRTRTGTPYFGTSVIPRSTTGSGSSRTGASSTREATTRSTSDISA